MTTTYNQKSRLVAANVYIIPCYGNSTLWNSKNESHYEHGTRSHIKIIIAHKMMKTNTNKKKIYHGPR